MAAMDVSDTILVAVVGVTGSGKSSFIKRVTGNESIEIGHDLRSKTAVVQTYPFVTNGKNFVLIDTPGFDDGERTDEDIFESLAHWLRQSYNSGQRLNALLYLHGIIANREKGSDLRNLRVFKKLCGEENFSKIILGITWWDQVDPQTALARETMLMETPEFWGEMVQKGSRIERIPHDKTQCIQLLHRLAENQGSPLRIQREMAGGKKAMQTTAAKEMDQYKAINAIKDAEVGERMAQSISYQLQSQAIESWASERRVEQHRRHQELQMQQMSQIEDLETIRLRMSELRPSQSSRRLEMTDRTRRMEDLAEALEKARFRSQPPKYSPDDIIERMRITTRSNLHYGKIVSASQQLVALGDEYKQNWSAIINPTRQDNAALWYSFCDRCLRQASINGYWKCEKCLALTLEDMGHHFEDLDVAGPGHGYNASWMLICNQCKERGLTCLDRSHALEQCLPGPEDPNEAIEDLVRFCPRARYISAGMRCNHCGRVPGSVFLHCCECDNDDFDLCLECFVEKGKTCRKRKKHTLFLHSWCPPMEWRRIQGVVEGMA